MAIDITFLTNPRKICFEFQPDLFRFKSILRRYITIFCTNKQYFFILYTKLGKGILVLCICLKHPEVEILLQMYRSQILHCVRVWSNKEYGFSFLYIPYMPINRLGVLVLKTINFLSDLNKIWQYVPNLIYGSMRMYIPSFGFIVLNIATPILYLWKIELCFLYANQPILARYFVVSYCRIGTSLKLL